MIGNQRHNLIKEITLDLLAFGKIPLILLTGVLFSAICVVNIVHNTRLLTSERERLVLERNALDIEWRNLILEENALGDHSRIERVAIQNLKMKHVEPGTEKVVVQQYSIELSIKR